MTSGEVADEHLLDRLLKEHAGTTGRTVAEVVADTKYGTHANYTALEQAGIRASIPSVQRRAPAGRLRGRPLRLRGRRRPLPLPHRPAPHPLRRLAHGRPGRRRDLPRPRRRCAAPARSGPSAAGGAAARAVIRPNDQALRDRVAAYLRTRAARRHLRRRAPWVETANAELKERHGLRRARGRGRDRMLLQALGAAMAYDVKKLAQRPPTAPPRGAPPCRPPARRPLTACRRPANRIHARDQPGRCLGRRGRSRPRSARRAAPVEPDFGNGPYSSTSVHLAVR